MTRHRAALTTSLGGFSRFEGVARAPTSLRQNRANAGSRRQFRPEPERGKATRPVACLSLPAKTPATRTLRPSRDVRRRPSCRANPMQPKWSTHYADN